jgi:hypothetical protein
MVMFKPEDMPIIQLDMSKTTKYERKDVCVVSVGTEAFKRGNTYHYSRTLRVLKSETTYDILGDVVQSIGTQEALESIVNLHDVSDGKYLLVACNISRDWETNMIDDYDLKLVGDCE